MTAEPDYLDVDVVEEDSGALPIGVSAVQSELPLDLEGGRPSGRGRRRRGRCPEFDDSTAAIRTPSDVDFEGDELADEYDEAEPDGTEHDYEYVDDSSGLEAASDTDVRLADSLSEARRNRYESKTAEAVSARKYRFRKNMLLVMGVALVATAVVAYVVTPAMWWACGSVGAVTLLYLAYLRRQTRIEEQLRRRRAQRMARSRLGVENTQDSEFDVVPARLRRPGSAVLEIDDEDPIFEHLEYATYAEYRLRMRRGSSSSRFQQRRLDW